MSAVARLGAILIIDDDRDFTDIITELLALEGFKAQAVASLAEGLAALEQPSFALVLTDSFTLVYSEEAMAPLQQLTVTAAGIPVVLLTGHGEAAQLDLAKIGLAGRLLKPFEADELLALVRCYVMPPG